MNFGFPNLRFNDKNGIHFPDWKFKLGNEVFENISNKRHNSDLPILAITQDYGAIPRDLIDFKITVTDKSVESYKVVEVGDFIISLRSFQGGIEYSEYKGICSPAYIILRPSISIDRIFFKYYLKTPKYITHLNRKLEGIRDGKMISYSYFSDIILPLPSIEEQNKVSTFLSLIENRIQTQRKIIEQLETLIKGVSYKLFNKKIRFKNTDLSEFPSWETKKGNEVFSNISNKNHNSELPILAITQEYGAIPRELIDFKISVSDKSVESYKIVEKGDFIISLRSFQGGIEYSEYKGICSPAYIILRNKIEVNSYYYKYYFKSEYYIKQLNKKLEGIRDGKMISYTYFSDINLPLPSINEQTKIANFLSSLQEKIEAEKQILEKLELQQKFLLANLFV
ncbi:restriction endonuclease subunit S [Chryseobacterium caseinilyticum]|uniref:Restriction endonuclease subunit S n=1 Tax=Chryseobacterium caseinilyticum TaxID=2771428 RepID=A0ABR8Z817_9FLAO|nr:restriction endonuclease subunit S [Chryseobacterium caseinilyticum]MBD8080906.1 restriction endonuclease subunit S [Chryseobacterium caseinilyticum]